MPLAQTADQVGAATLERMAAAPRFNRWMFERLRPWIGRRVLEIGAGIGNMSAFLVDQAPVDRVVLTDTEPVYLGRLRERFAGRPHVSVAELRLPAQLRTAGFRVRHLEYFNLAGVPGWWLTGRLLRRRLIPTGALRWYEALVPLFRLERLLPWRIGQSLIAIGEVGG